MPGMEKKEKNGLGKAVHACNANTQRPKQKYYKLETSLGYIVRSIWNTKQDPFSKSKQRTKKDFL
jgi:hypothetical protein